MHVTKVSLQRQVTPCLIVHKICFLNIKFVKIVENNIMRIKLISTNKFEKLSMKNRFDNSTFLIAEEWNHKFESRYRATLVHYFARHHSIIIKL